MAVVSFDCGIRNFAYCIYDGASGSILAWDVVSLHQRKKVNIGESVSLITPLIESILLESYSMGERCIIDEVVIEQQPPANITMKVISHVIQAISLASPHSLRVSFMSPKVVHRKCGIAAKGATYRQRKQNAVSKTQLLLADIDIHMGMISNWSYWFQSQPKKDDLADCFLQAISHFMP